MQIKVEDRGEAATVVLDGRLDIMGAEVIDLPLATLSGTKKELLIDMSRVTFVASIGLRHLVSASKVLMRRGGKLILMNPVAVVAEVITTSGLDDILPMQRTVAE